MSFGTNNTSKTAENNLGGTSNLALNNQFPAVTAQANNLFSAGQPNVTAGTNYLNTILGGNQANTTAALQPSIDQIRNNNSNALTAINTLMPRGGGRSGALFSQALQPASQIQNLFNGARTTAATALPQIGLQQQNLGANLFGLGNGALSAATGANQALGQQGFQAQQQSNQLMSGIGSGILGLATLPFGGAGTATATKGLFGLIPGLGSA